jgi:hypothetical protein
MPCHAFALLGSSMPLSSGYPLPLLPAIHYRYFRLSVLVLSLIRTVTCVYPLPFVPFIRTAFWDRMVWSAASVHPPARRPAPLRSACFRPPARLVWLLFCVLFGFVRLFVCLSFSVRLFVSLFDPFGFAPKPDKFPITGTPTCSSRRRRRAKSGRTSARAGAAPLHAYSRVLTGTLGVLFVRVRGGYLAGSGRGPI